LSPLVPKPPVGVTRGLIRHRDKRHVGTIWLNRDIDYEFEDPATGQRHTSPIPRDIVWVIIRARGEEICRLRISVAELMGAAPFSGGSPRAACRATAPVPAA